MKKSILLLLVAVSVCLFEMTGLHAQQDSLKYSFSANADIYSNYIWRGTNYGNGPSFQPAVKFLAGGLTLGVWGSFDASGYSETDPYVSYALPFGLSLGFTDYYYPRSGGSFFSDSANAYEFNLGYTWQGLSLGANYIFNKASTAGSLGDDMYFQAGYAFKKFNMGLGAGNGWHTHDGEFNVCNIFIGTGKTIVLTDKFSIPVNGQVVVNPDRKQIFVLVGFSL